MKKAILFCGCMSLFSLVEGQNTSVLAKPVGGELSPHDPVPKPLIQGARSLRERLLNDPYRPAYHFAIPEDNALPGDPNGAFYANGRYHLMYLYHREGRGFSWGHMSSKDLLHWRYHPDALLPGNGDDGVFSGGAFADSNGVVTLSYWQFQNNETRKRNEANNTREALGIGIAQSSDPDYSIWKKSDANPVIPSTEWGITIDKDKNGEEVIYGSADPSNIWKKNGKYYILTGNLLVLNKYGRKAESSPSMRGDHSYLFESDDMKQWKYLHEFYKSDRKWTDTSEDNMCPSFLPLPSSAEGGKFSGKHLLLFISHNKGCQYYIGDYRGDRFFPSDHGRMTWKDNAYFAPEALIDSAGRQIMWSWIFDDRPDSIKQYSGWSGTYGLPRTLWLGKDGTLRMRPVKELEQLRQGPMVKKNLTIQPGNFISLDEFGKELMELEITLDPGNATRVGVQVGRSGDGRESTSLYYDVPKQVLAFDATQSGIGFGRKIVEEGPLKLTKGELLTLRVFVDKSIIEVYANDKQAIARNVYPQLGGTGIRLFADGGAVKVHSVKAWELMPANPY